MDLEDLSYADLTTISATVTALIDAADHLGAHGFDVRFSLAPGHEPRIILPGVLFPSDPAPLPQPNSSLVPAAPIAGADALGGGSDAAPAEVQGGLSVQEKQAIFTLSCSGMKTAEIAEELNLSIERVIDVQLQQAGAISTVLKTTAQVEADAKFIAAHVPLGWTAQMIGDELGLAPSVVERIIEDLKLEVRKPAPEAVLTPTGLLRAGVTPEIAEGLADALKPAAPEIYKPAPEAVQALDAAHATFRQESDIGILTSPPVVVGIDLAAPDQNPTLAARMANVWTAEEDAELVELVAIARTMGTPINAALNTAAEQLGRPFKACNVRAYTKLKDRIAARVAQLRSMKTGAEPQTQDAAEPAAEGAALQAVAPEAQPEGKPSGETGGLQQLSPVENAPLQGAALQAVAPEAAPPVEPAPVFPEKVTSDPIFQHLMRLPAKGWALTQDAELMRLACAGWKIHEIAGDMGRDVKGVQARFDMLTGLDRETKTRRFKMQAVADALEQLTGSAVTDGAAA